MSVLYASNRPAQDIYLCQVGHTVSASSAFQKQEIHDIPPNFAADEIDGISSCPTAINCQLSLLCWERARELEHDILVDLQKLIFDPSAKKNDSETLFV